MTTNDILAIGAAARAKVSEKDPRRAQIASLHERIAALEAENAALASELASAKSNRRMRRRSDDQR